MHMDACNILSFEGLGGKAQHVLPAFWWGACVPSLFLKISR